MARPGVRPSAWQSTGEYGALGWESRGACTHKHLYANSFLDILQIGHFLASRAAKQSTVRACHSHQDGSSEDAPHPPAAVACLYAPDWIEDARVGERARGACMACTQIERCLPRDPIGGRAARWLARLRPCSHAYISLISRGKAIHRVMSPSGVPAVQICRYRTFQSLC